MPALTSPTAALYQDRHECKYVVDERTAALVRRRVLPFVAPDAHTTARNGHGYEIASLYLDDEPHTFYHETREGRNARHKLRVRSYSDDPAAPLYLEVKRRRDRVVQKVRCPIARDRLPAILEGVLERATDREQRGRGALEAFVLAMLADRATPRCLVRYRREAWVGRDDDRVRVTFDREIAAAWHRRPSVPLLDAGYRPVPTPRIVLEIKFTGRLPCWLATTIRACELQRRSCSKYRIAIDTLRGLPQSSAHDA